MDIKTAQTVCLTLFTSSKNLGRRSRMRIKTNGAGTHESVSWEDQKVATSNSCESSFGDFVICDRFDKPLVMTFNRC